MKKVLTWLYVLLYVLLCSGASNAEVPPATPMEESRVVLLECADSATQIVLVEYNGRTDCTVSLHEKQDGIWREQASSYGYLGRTGMGKTRTGDNKTPVGTFNLTTPFGILDDPGSIQPYTKVSEYHYWCGSSDSPYYNQFVDSRVTGRAGTSSDEILIEYTGFYNYCMFIDYNAEGVPGKGSCIFLHCIGNRDWTHGCVAVPEEFMAGVLRWAREGTKIVICPDVLTEDSSMARVDLDGVAGYVVGTARSLNVRLGPGTGYGVIGTLSMGERADYLNKSRLDDNGMLWYCVVYNGMACWVSSNYAVLFSE